MPNARSSYVPPSTKESAFNCPHCSAFTQQSWYDVLGYELRGETPTIITERDVEQAQMRSSASVGADRQVLQKVAALRRLAKGQPGVEYTIEQRANTTENLFLSRCTKCHGVSLWIYDRLVWPSQSTAPSANSDLPDEVKALYDEARTIVGTSPRGAAALLRLGIQILCKSLGETGENLNSDIASLVTKGLDVKVRMALDVVRVVGNNAVHPGQIDMSDDVETATKLFSLVNLIADIMLTQPKHIEEMYKGLPKRALDAIKKRDQK